MKNILIGILSIVSLGSLFYAYSQRTQMSDCAIERGGGLKFLTQQVEIKKMDTFFCFPKKEGQ